MLRKTIVTAAAVIFSLGAFSAPAQAAHCPKDVKKIQAAMSKMDKGKMMSAKDAAAKGLALHKGGKHGESIKVLHEAMKILGISH
jgi:hypothetical protein